MPIWYDNLLSKLEITFLVFFTVELLLKWFGLGSDVYFQSYFNIFDLIVIALSWLDYIIKAFFPEFSLGISILRALRLLKAFKVTSGTGNAMREYKLNPAMQRKKTQKTRFLKSLESKFFIEIKKLFGIYWSISNWRYFRLAESSTLAGARVIIFVRHL